VRGSYATPGANVEVESGKDERIGKQDSSIQRNAFRINNVFGQRFVGCHRLRDSVLRSGHVVRRRSRVVTKMLVCGNDMYMFMMVFINVTFH